MSDKCSSPLFLSTGNCCVFFLGTSILLLSFCLAVDPDVGIRQHEEDEITVVGSGGDMSGGVVGGGGGVASGGGGG